MQMLHFGKKQSTIGLNPLCKIIRGNWFICHPAITLVEKQFARRKKKSVVTQKRQERKKKICDERIFRATNNSSHHAKSSRKREVIYFGAKILHYKAFRRASSYQFSLRQFTAGE